MVNQGHINSKNKTKQKMVYDTWLVTEKVSGSLRRLSESSILIGSAMFGATFKLVTRVKLPYFFEHRKMVVFNTV